MSELERLYRQLVLNLMASDPARLDRSLSLSDIQDTIVPYRANRRALQLESSEEYELALMRLCAGEGGFARAEPEEARAEFVAELCSPNPDLSLVRRHGQTAVRLESERLARALRPPTDSAYAPPQDRLPLVQSRPRPRSGPEPSSPAKMSKGESPGCVSCGGVLPAGRKLKFCPHCGVSQALTSCPECRAELEPVWKHCVACGAAVNP